MDAPLSHDSVVRVERPGEYLQPSKRAELFARTAEELSDTEFSQEFDAYCGGTFNEDGDPTHDDMLRFATYVAEQNKDEMRRTNERTPEMAVRELLAATPLAIFDQVRIDDNEYKPDDEFRDLRLRVSHYLGLIQEVASHFSELHVGELLGYMFDAANLGFRPADMKQFGQSYLRAFVDGAMHEYGFMQLARAAGLTCEHATDEEDVDQGIDVHVWTARGVYIPVNVKASDKTVMAHGGQAHSFAADEHGLITITSGIHPADYNDRFRIANHVLKDRAQACQEMFAQIALRRTALGVGALTMKRYAV